jgi:hypothetical protein
VKSPQIILALLDEGYEKRTWHGPNLKQALRGVSSKHAAWRPASDRHNIWEEAVHAAYWKYEVRRRIEGRKSGSFALNGKNFFARPEKGKQNEAATVIKALKTPRRAKFIAQLYGVAFHDVYHAGQIRLLRRLQG